MWLTTSPLFVILMSCLHLGISIPRRAHVGYIPYNNTESRIVGGSNVLEGQYVPYQVSLQYNKDNEYHHFCGGSIISENRILTAAHCCVGFNPDRMSVVAGIRDLNDNSGTRAQVTTYEIHENYQQLVTSDIAILKIEPPLQLDGTRIAAIDVSGQDYVNGGTAVTLTGWGLRLPIAIPLLPSGLATINYPTQLQTMTYRTISNQECRNAGMENLTETEICAKAGPLVFQGACSGDSGGPLVRSTKNGLNQVGIVSYGLFICAVFDVPDVYTRVSMFDDWIQKRM